MEPRGRSLAAVASVIILMLIIIMSLGIIAVIGAGVTVAFSGGEIEAKLAQVLHAAVVPTRAELLFLFAALVILLGLAVAMLQRLRRVVLTVRNGEPFHERNPSDLRIIALLLALGEILTTVAFLAIPEGLRGEHVKYDFDLTSWFAVLIVLVLAEVFREGVRLRRDAELTV